MIHLVCGTGFQNSQPLGHQSPPIATRPRLPHRQLLFATEIGISVNGRHQSNKCDKDIQHLVLGFELTASEVWVSSDCNLTWAPSWFISNFKSTVHFVFSVIPTIYSITLAGFELVSLLQKVHHGHAYLSIKKKLSCWFRLNWVVVTTSWSSKQCFS